MMVGDELRANMGYTVIVPVRASVLISPDVKGPWHMLVSRKNL
jgi:hypothetical protein